MQTIRYLIFSNLGRIILFSSLATIFNILYSNNIWMPTSLIIQWVFVIALVTQCLLYPLFLLLRFIAIYFYNKFTNNHDVE